MATWHTPDTVRAEWPDAVQIDDDLLAELVIVARDAVIAYAPARPQADPPAESGFGHGPFGGTSEDDIPTRYRLAQLIQIKNVWNAAITSASGEFGGETYAIQPRPLDWHVKALLRPATGRPRVG